MTDSSAAITRRTASMPWAPASMLRTKRSWPGTSMNEATTPSPRSAGAKPRASGVPPAFAQGRGGEAGVDGYPPLLLLLQPVGVGAGEREDERALAVVDVACGA